MFGKWATANGQLPVRTGHVQIPVGAQGELASRPQPSRQKLNRLGGMQTIMAQQQGVVTM